LSEYADVPEKLEAARQHYEEALRLDPNYAAALAGLSTIEALYYRNLEPNQAHLQRAEELAQRAFALDPQLPEGHLARGYLYADRYDYVRAAQEFREATQLQPDNADAWSRLSWVLGYQQPPDAKGAEEVARQSIRLQPALFRSYYYLGRAQLFQLN
jgi:eukaryotic-like serine/threonine-protein kinase